MDRRPAVLAAHHAGGVTKKAKTSRKAVLSSRARRRLERSVGRAEAVQERTAVKVQKSKSQARVIHARKKTWDEINREVFDGLSGAGVDTRPRLSKKARARLDEDAMVKAFYAAADEDGDAEMAGADEDEDVNVNVNGEAQDAGGGQGEEESAGAVQPASVPLPPPAATDEDEEIL